MHTAKNQINCQNSSKLLKFLKFARSSSTRCSSCARAGRAFRPPRPPPPPSPARTRSAGSGWEGRRPRTGQTSWRRGGWKMHWQFFFQVLTVFLKPEYGLGKHCDAETRVLPTGAQDQLAQLFEGRGIWRRNMFSSFNKFCSNVVQKNADIRKVVVSS